MSKSNFWNDAAKYGTFIALVSIAFSVLGMYLTNGLLSLASITVYVYLLYTFVRRRAMTYKTSEEGYSYGRCLTFVFAMMLFAGILEGAYGAVAYNWLFADKYQAQIALALSSFESSGFYTSDMFDMMLSFYKSPIVWVVAGVLGGFFKGLIFGLVICAFTKQEPDLFPDSEA